MLQVPPADVEYCQRLMDAWEFNTAMANLSRCLRDAGALCRAWELGNNAYPQAYEEWVHVSETHLARVGAWFPGCGWAAPEENV